MLESVTWQELLLWLTILLLLFNGLVWMIEEWAAPAHVEVRDGSHFELTEAFRAEVER